MSDRAQFVVRRKGEDFTVTIDAEDVERVNRHRWFCDSQGYVSRNAVMGGRRTRQKLHRFLLNLPPGDDPCVDHINRDRLDNRKANLRTLTRAQNSQNKCSTTGASSVYRGVHWDPRNKRWRAFVKHRGVRTHLGLFADELEAARVASDRRRSVMPFSYEPPEWAHNVMVAAREQAAMMADDEGATSA